MLAGVFCGLLAGAMWGVVFIAPKVLASFSPVALMVGRYVAYGAIATLVLLPNLKTLAPKLAPHHVLILTPQALTGSLVYYVLLALGVKYAGVAPTSIVIGLLPLAITWLGRRDKGSLPLSQMAVPLILMLASVVALNLEAFLGAKATGAADLLLFGLACAVGALLCWSWYALDNARYLKDNPHFTSSQWSGLYGVTCGVLALVAGFVLTRFFGQSVPLLSGGGNWFWTCNLALALVTSVIANYFWNVASRRVPISLSAQLGSSETLFAIIYGTRFDDAGPKTSEVLAICCLGFGIGLSIYLHLKRHFRLTDDR
jgi:drug/metabolite transporter (DMT)-like permease